MRLFRAKGALIILCLVFLIDPGHLLAQNTVTVTPTPEVVQLLENTGTTIVVPQGSPWWAVIIISVVSFLIYGGRKYVDNRFKEQESRRVASDEERRLALSEKQQDKSLDLAQVQQIGSLADSINKMAQSVTKAYTDLAEDRRQAAIERGEFKTVSEEHSANIYENTNAIKTLSDAVKDANSSNQGEHRKTREQVDLVNKKIDRVIGMLEKRIKPALESDDTRDMTLDVVVSDLKETKNEVSKLAEGDKGEA